MCLSNEIFATILIYTFERVFAFKISLFYVQFMLRDDALFCEESLIRSDSINNRKTATIHTFSFHILAAWLFMRHFSMLVIMQEQHILLIRFQG